MNQNLVLLFKCFRFPLVAMVNRLSSISIKARGLPKAKAIENYVTLFFAAISVFSWRNGA